MKRRTVRVYHVGIKSRAGPDYEASKDPRGGFFPDEMPTVAVYAIEARGMADAENRAIRCAVEDEITRPMVGWCCEATKAAMSSFRSVGGALGFSDPDYLPPPL